MTTTHDNLTEEQQIRDLVCVYLSEQDRHLSLVVQEIRDLQWEPGQQEQYLEFVGSSWRAQRRAQAADSNWGSGDVETTTGQRWGSEITPKHYDYARHIHGLKEAEFKAFLVTEVDVTNVCFGQPIQQADGSWQYPYDRLDAFAELGINYYDLIDIFVLCGQSQDLFRDVYQRILRLAELLKDEESSDDESPLRRPIEMLKSMLAEKSHELTWNLMAEMLNTIHKTFIAPPDLMRELADEEDEDEEDFEGAYADESAHEAPDEGDDEDDDGEDY
jgi:hypothetical protein